MASENVYVMPDGSIKPVTRGRPPKGANKGIRDTETGKVKTFGVDFDGNAEIVTLTSEDIDCMAKAVKAEKDYAASLANEPKPSDYANVSLDQDNSYIALAPLPIESASEPLQVVTEIPSPFNPITWVMEAGKGMRKL